MSLKQVIVIRKDLGMRKGKMIAQGAHASLNAALKAQSSKKHKENFETWLKEGTTKICVSVGSEEELKKVFQEAASAGLPCSLIKDAGKTEFKEPTYTAVCIGPADTNQIDKITGELKLL